MHDSCVIEACTQQHLLKQLLIFNWSAGSLFRVSEVLVEQTNIQVTHIRSHERNIVATWIDDVMAATRLRWGQFSWYNFCQKLLHYDFRAGNV